MSEQVYLGVDLGAESGRVVAGLWDGRRMRLEELHRFPNGAVSIAGSLRWDVLRLWAEIQNGLALGARHHGQTVASVGVDTWGVDFALLSKSEELLGLPFQYRDARTRGIMAKTFERVPREEIFAATGIQFMEINTLYQLLALKEHSPEILETADAFLMIADWLNWCLCGAKVVEFTNATTTQFLHPTRRDWSVELLGKLGLPTKMLPPVVAPGSKLGVLRESVSGVSGLGRVEVVAPATHDTGAAVVGVPTAKTGRANWAYISSGTWSLMGVEVPRAVLTPRALEWNLTNEGGVDGTYRLLKNIMGLWLVQQCKRAFDARGRTFDHAELVRLAGDAPPLRSLVNPDDARFLAPADMPQAIQEFCRESGQPVPESEGALVRCALESLALKYRTVLAGLEQVTGTSVEVIHIVGGGSRNHLLNQFTATACGRPALAGPVEATVLGNLLLQVRARGELSSLADIRSVVRATGDVTEVEPEPPGPWADACERFARLCSVK